jgi:hypothetical protein
VNKPMTVKELKEFIASIPQEFDDRPIWYVDFNGRDKPEAKIADVGDERVVIE